VLPVVVVGAGPAGLAASHELKRRGVEHVVLERGSDVGHSWAMLYDSLTLHTGKHMSALPGMRFPRRARLFVPREEFLDYLRRYARHFALPVRTGCDVRSIRPRGNGARWRVEAVTNGELVALDTDAVVVATGIVANPRAPHLRGEDAFTTAGKRLLHSADYRRPNELVGQRVLIVGAGNSGAEIASEIAKANATQGKAGQVTIAVRSGANVVPRTLLGIPVQYIARYLRKLPKGAREAVVHAVGSIVEKRHGPPVLPRPAYGPLDAIPIIGFHLNDAIRAGLVRVRGAVAELTPRGARFADGREPAEEPVDVVILATGFAAALAPLAGLVRCDAKGFAHRTGRVVSVDHPGLYFVGHNYDATGGLFNIGRDAEALGRILGGA
jgi:cation diffusion facilitator CzcD-associated flavoprotein CzcO